MSKLHDSIKNNGKTPSVALIINPLEKARAQIVLDKFISYSFQSSILIPVDTFQFKFAMPTEVDDLSRIIREGDLVQLIANNKVICTGIIDVVDIETTLEYGDIAQVTGRNLLSQLEDQSAVNAANKPLWGNNITLQTAVGAVIQRTRIIGLIEQQAPAGSFLFATAPGESKLSALQRFIEPLNCLLWADPKGYLVVGRPNMGQDARGSIVCDKKNRTSNVLSIKAVRASTQIPNTVIAIWTGQESVQDKVAPQQSVNNSADGPKRLRQLGHFVPKAVVVSTPQGADPQSLSDANAFKVYSSTILQAYALREVARANVQELEVQANVQSHYNDDLQPFLIDQVYHVNYPRAGVQEKMYLYQVEYSMDMRSGPRTSLSFCRLGTIVAGSSLQSVSKVVSNSGSLPTL